MKAINTGNIYKIFDDSLKTFDQLPAQTYVVRFSKQEGFFLEKYVNIEISEEKIYGVHINKLNKVLRSFSQFTRSMGVILSGDKGIGKSLFAKLLSLAAINGGIPVIVVDTYIPGIASYIESIDQEVLVLFDEFDKTFGEVRAADGEASPQATLLSLFDGISGGKKLYVVTCNELRKLNEYLINRPGRFHYHLRFDYPSADEIREYMMDKIPEECYGEIDEVIKFSTRVNLNYDCLRAIAFEIASGETFKSAIQDLNIMNMQEEMYDIILCFNNGYKVTNRNCNIDMFCDMQYEYSMYDREYNTVGRVEFTARDSAYEYKFNANVLYEGDFSFTYTRDDDDPDEIKAARESGVKCLMIKRQKQKDLHYAV